MYAIIKSGGKQYRVTQGDVIEVDLLGLENGSKVEFNDVLMVSDGQDVRFGQPLMQGCSVVGELIDEVKGEKLIGMKYKRRKQERKTFGHRQRYSRVKVLDIVGTEKAKR